MMKGIVNGGLHFREAIKNAFGACDLSYDAIANRCGISRQTIWYAMKGKCKMRPGTAQAIMIALTDGLNAEINSETARIDMLKRLIDDLKSSYDRDYAGEGKRNE